MKQFYIIIFAILFSLTSAPSFANDSTATIGAGGLVLTKSDKIAIESENLYISPHKIEVAYIFKNISSENITALVTFPFPVLKMEDYSEQDVPEFNEAPWDNFYQFEVKTDGEKINFKKEIKAFANGKDVTQELVKRNLPYGSYSRKLHDELQKLSAEDKKNLEDLHIITSHGDYYAASWNVETKFYWEQSFPAGKEISINHRYIPVTGKTFFTPASFSYTQKPYCIDSGTQAEIKKKFSLSSKTENLSSYNVEYILKTGANWAGPIKNFKLTIDKEKPEAVASLCFDGIKKTGPTTFSTEIKNFTPQQDLKIIFLNTLK